MILSLLWSNDRTITIRGLVEGLPVLTSVLAGAAAWPLVFKPGDERFLFGGIAACAMLIGFEKFCDMRLHRLVGSRTFHSDLKRSAVPLAVLLWPALFACRRSGHGALAGGLVLLAAAGIMLTNSGASFFGLIAGALAFGVARWAPSAALGIATFLLVVVAIGSGWLGTSARHGLPAPIVTSLSSVHAVPRIRIWRAFERRVFERPLLGHGFNTSVVISPDLLPDDITPEMKTPSLAGIHPHSMFLQVWIELGAIGVGASLATILFVMARIRTSRPAAMPLHLGLLVTIISIGLVSMSAWQPWWLALTGVGMLWFRVADPEPSVGCQADRS